MSLTATTQSTTTPITILQRPKTMNTNNSLLTKKSNGLTMTYSKRNAVIDGFKLVDGSIADDEKIVCPGLHKMAEISVSADNHAEITNHPFFKDQTFNMIDQYTINDGTMIRLFYHNGEWKKSTNRCINADSASWGPVKSFGGLFDDAAKYYNLDYSRLNTEHCYVFVMQHPTNRIVEPVPSFPVLYHVDTMQSNGSRINEDIGIQKNNQIHYQTIDEMVQFLLHPDTPWVFQGFLLINSRNERLKLENPKYTRVHTIKGNVITETGAWKLKDHVHSYSFRLFQIIQAEQESEFLQYFDEFVQPMITIKEDIVHLSESVWETYKQRYIFKNTEYPQAPELKTFLNFLHYQYHTTKQAITFKKCLTAVKNCPTNKLMYTLGYTNYK